MSRLINRGRQTSGLKKATEGDPAAPPPEVARRVTGEITTPAPVAGADVVHRIAATLPTPYEAPDDAGALGEGERRDLVTCEAALDHLRLAFWVAGRALQVIRDARLYRDTHETFEAYCLDRWGLSRPHAYRLIGEWRLAERLVIVSPFGDTISESHVRSLLPCSLAHGDDAAEIVFMTVAETEGVRLTADVLRGAVEVLPAGPFDQAEAVIRIREFLAGYGSASREKTADSSTAGFERQAIRAKHDLERVAKRISGAPPPEIRRFVSEMRALLDEIEASASDI